MTVVRSPLQLAQAQLAGGVLFDGQMVCQLCGHAVTVKAGLDPCAFCNGCKDAALDVLAETIVAMKAQLRRMHR